MTVEGTDCAGSVTERNTRMKELEKDLVAQIQSIQNERQQAEEALSASRTLKCSLLEEKEKVESETKHLRDYLAQIPGKYQAQLEQEACECIQFITQTPDTFK